MNTWQERFSKKIEMVRQASAERFERIASDTINSVFTEFQEFTDRHGLSSAAPMARKGLRTFKFSVAENTYVLVTIRMAGIEHCEAQCEFFVPGKSKIPPHSKRIELGSVEEGTLRNVFQDALDAFMDAYLDTLQGDDYIKGEPALAAGS